MTECAKIQINQSDFSNLKFGKKVNINIWKESKFKKKQLPLNLNELNEAMSFSTKPLKYKICPNVATVNDNLKILHISAVFKFDQYQYSSPWKCLLSFQVLEC